MQFCQMLVTIRSMRCTDAVFLQYTAHFGFFLPAKKTETIYQLVCSWILCGLHGGKSV